MVQIATGHSQCINRYNTDKDICSPSATQSSSPIVSRLGHGEIGIDTAPQRKMEKVANLAEPVMIA